MGAEKILNWDTCYGVAVDDAKHAGHIVFRCESGLIVLPKTPIPKDAVPPNHEFVINFVRKKNAKTGKEYGILLSYEPIHKTVIERRLTKTLKPGRLVIEGTVTERCELCSYSVTREVREELGVDAIKIDGKLYYIDNRDFDYDYREVEGDVVVDPDVRPVEYMKLSSGIYVPKDFVGMSTMAVLLGLDAVYRELSAEFDRASRFDVFVVEKGKYAKIEKKDEYEWIRKYELVPVAKTPKGWVEVRVPIPENRDKPDVIIHHVEKYVYEDGTEEVKLEYYADGRVYYEVWEEGWEEERDMKIAEVEGTRKVVRETKYTEVKVSDILHDLYSKMQEVKRRQREVLWEELEKKGFRLSNSGDVVEISAPDGTKSYMRYNNEGYVMLKGKFSLLAL